VADPMDPFGTADDNGCYPLTTATARKPTANPMRDFRFGNGGGTAMRHIFE
jgi:hypothetical protein